jgi:hypothetical protein
MFESTETHRDLTTGDLHAGFPSGPQENVGS